MSESKKLNSQFKSIFWAIIYSLPLVVLFIYFISFGLCFKESGNSEILSLNLFDESLKAVNQSFSNFTWNVLNDSLINVFDLLGLEFNSNIANFILVLFVWFIQFSIIHIIIDILLIIPNIYHYVIERWFKKC